jgi:hypothetical protein
VICCLCCQMVVKDRFANQRLESILSPYRLSARIPLSERFEIVGDNQLTAQVTRTIVRRLIHPDQWRQPPHVTICQSSNSHIRDGDLCRNSLASVISMSLKPIGKIAPGRANESRWPLRDGYQNGMNCLREKARAIARTRFPRSFELQSTKSGLLTEAKQKNAGLPSLPDAVITGHHKSRRLRTPSRQKVSVDNCEAISLVFFERLLST